MTRGDGHLTEPPFGLLYALNAAVLTLLVGTILVVIEGDNTASFVLLGLASALTAVALGILLWEASRG